MKRKVRQFYSTHLLRQGNSQTDLKVENEHPDYIILTHGHGDHVGDTVELAKKSGALVIANNEIANYLSWQGINTHPMHMVVRSNLNLEK